MASPMAVGERRLTAKHGDSTEQFKFDLPVKDMTQIKAGSLAMLDSSGDCLPAANTGGTVVVGCAEFQAGSEDTSLSPQPLVRVRTGVFSWDINGSLDDTDIGSIVYVYDDHTVTATGTAGTTMSAGIFLGLDDKGQAKVATSPVINGVLKAAFAAD